MARFNGDGFVVIAHSDGRPCRHDTLEEAVAEATRLAEQSPGNRFTVLQPVKSVLCPKGPTRVTNATKRSYGPKQAKPVTKADIPF